MSSGLPVGAFKAPPEKTLQSRRPPESDATERPPRDRLPSACMTRCARGSSPEGSGGRGPWLGIDVKDYFLSQSTLLILRCSREARASKDAHCRGGAPNRRCVLRGSAFGL